jgi:hypothetical protein
MATETMAGRFVELLERLDRDEGRTRVGVLSKVLAQVVVELDALDARLRVLEAAEEQRRDDNR